MKPDPEKHCAACSTRLMRARMNGRLEDMAVFLRRKYCNRKCMANGQMKEVLTRSGYLVRARKHLGQICESCGTPTRLSIHHKDRNWRNNNPSNLQTLCASCHTSLHHSAGEICPKRGDQPCESCGRISQRRFCNTCRTRIRRYGVDLVLKLGPSFCWRRASFLLRNKIELQGSGV